VIYYHGRSPRRNVFSKSNNSSCRSVVWVRHRGPRWVAAGRRPKMVPVFFIQRTTLGGPPANALSLFGMGAGNTGAVIPGAAQ
jgi:hypothetical protein